MNDEGVSVLYGDEDLRSEFDFCSRFASHYRTDVRLGEVDYPLRRTVRPRIQHVLLLTVHFPRGFKHLSFTLGQQILSKGGRRKQATDGAQVPRKAGDLLLERSPELLPADVSLFAGDSRAPGGDSPVGAGLLLSGLPEDCPDRVEKFLRGDPGGGEKLEVRGIGDVGGAQVASRMSVPLGSASPAAGDGGSCGAPFGAGVLLPQGVSGLPEDGVSPSFPSTGAESPSVPEADFSSFFAASSLSLRLSKMRRSRALSVSTSRRFRK